MKTRLLIIIVIGVLGFSTSVFAFESDDPDPLELWASNELIIDGTVIEVDTERTFSEELIRSYQIKVHEYFKGSHKFDLVYAQESVNNKYFKTGERILFYLYKDNSNSYQVHSASLKTFENCNARDLIEISPVLPNEKSPISTPVFNEDFIDSCVPYYYDVDPDFGGVTIYPAPLKQVNAGIEPQNVQCQDPNKTLVLKIDGSPACVKHESATKLITRTGWMDNLDAFVYPKSKLIESEMMPLDIASVEDKYVHLNPVDMCATISLRLLSSDDLKHTTSGTKDVVFFELDDQSMNEFPILGELIRATHYIESPSNEHARTEIGLREFVDYEFFIMEKAIAKYKDTQNDYFMKLDGNLDEKLADPKKQGFSNEFIAPQIVYRDKIYTMGSTVFWTADEHEMQSVSIRLQDNLKEDEKYITLTDKDMDSVPKIKQTIEKIGTELESIVAFKGMPENPDWNNHREWFDQKKIEQFNLSDVYVKGFVYQGEYYDLGFLIC